MEPHADALGSYDALRGLSDVVRATNDATYLRGQYEAQGSAEGMVNAAIERFRGKA
jgi:carboxylate-amine ligase